MTVKLSISVPDDVAAYLQSHGNLIEDALREFVELP